MKLLLSAVLAASTFGATINSGDVPIYYQDIGSQFLNIASPCGASMGTTTNVGAGSIPGTSWVACGTADATNSYMRFSITLPMGPNEALVPGTGVLILDTTADSGNIGFLGNTRTSGPAVIREHLDASKTYQFNPPWSRGAGIPLEIDLILTQASGPVKIDYQVTYETQYAESPEPGTLALAGFGVGLILFRRFRT